MHRMYMSVRLICSVSEKGKLAKQLLSLAWSKREQITLRQGQVVTTRF